MAKLNIPESLRWPANKKFVLIKQATLARLLESLRRNAAIAGDGLEEYESFAGTVFRAKRSAEDVGSLCLTALRPGYVPEPAEPPGELTRRLWVTMGTVNERLVNNWTDHFDITASSWFWLKVYFSENIDRLEVTDAEVVHGSTSTAHTSGTWGASGEFPPHTVIPLGYVDVTSGTVQNFGRGSVTMTAVLSNISQDVDGHSTFTRSLNFVRLEGAV